MVRVLPTASSPDSDGSAEFHAPYAGKSVSTDQTRSAGASISSVVS